MDIVGLHIAPKDLDPKVVEDYLNNDLHNDIIRAIKEDTYFAYGGDNGVRCVMLKSKFGMKKIQYDVFYA